MIPDTGKGILDMAAVWVFFGTVIDALPSISAILVVIWLGLRIWEMDTVRGWTNREKPDS